MDWTRKANPVRMVDYASNSEATGMLEDTTQNVSRQQTIFVPDNEPSIMFDLIKLIGILALITGGIRLVWNTQRDFVSNMITVFTLTFLVVVPVVFFLSLAITPSSPKTDPFESAAKKIDAGRSDSLSWEESQAVYDNLNRCKICNKPLRSCRHGQ